MPMKRLLLTLLALLLLTQIAFAQGAATPAKPSAVAEIEAFNSEFTAAHQRMDNAAIIAFWEEDGVSLLPGMAPLVGKAKISEMILDIPRKYPGFRVLKQEDEFHDIQVSGDRASEWALTHQVAQPPGDKPALDIHGKMLLVLHRDKDGHWKIKQEMWNSAE